MTTTIGIIFIIGASIIVLALTYILGRIVGFQKGRNFQSEIYKKNQIRRRRNTMPTKNLDYYLNDIL